MNKWTKTNWRKHRATYKFCLYELINQCNLVAWHHFNFICASVLKFFFLSLTNWKLKLHLKKKSKIFLYKSLRCNDCALWQKSVHGHVHELTPNQKWSVIAVRIETKEENNERRKNKFQFLVSSNWMGLDMEHVVVILARDPI